MGPPWSGAGWESVCWGLLGTPWVFFLDLEIYQDSTIVKFRFANKNLWETDCFWPTQNSNLFNKKSIVFKTMFCFKRICLRFKNLWCQKMKFSDSRNVQDPTIVKFSLYEYPMKKWLWTQGNHPEVIKNAKFPNTSLYVL